MKYELAHYEYYEDGVRWDLYEKGFAKNLKAAGQSVQGTMLVQMLSDRKIKVEVFAAGASQAIGFGSNAIVYER